MQSSDSADIGMKPIGYVRRPSSDDENTRDRSLVSEIVLREELGPALDGIEEWSHVYVIYWLNKVPRTEEPTVHFPGGKDEIPPVGILATRAPIHPNPIGLSLVEVVAREKNVLQVKGLDAYNGSPVLDLKPYPDWEQGRLLIVTECRIPKWLAGILRHHE
jgi:tRNA-Thr(GGU) m(6)t(6)A37 methyltransferase TsaA